MTLCYLLTMSFQFFFHRIKYVSDGIQIDKRTITYTSNALFILFLQRMHLILQLLYVVIYLRIVIFIRQLYYSKKKTLNNKNYNYYRFHVSILIMFHSKF